LVALGKLGEERPRVFFSAAAEARNSLTSSSK